MSILTSGHLTGGYRFTKMGTQENTRIMNSQYLPLTEYSSKYKVSISTLRRRIKADEIKFVFDDGKYMILDAPVNTHQKVHRPSLTSDKTSDVIVPLDISSRSGKRESPKSVMKPQEAAASVAAPKVSYNEPVLHPELRHLSQGDRQEPILSAANRLLTELKRAYTQVLQEKEEQILQLNAEISDLKTLVRALEMEHEKKNR